MQLHRCHYTPADSYEPPKGPAPKTSLPSKQMILIYTYGPRLSVGPGPYNVRSTKNLAHLTNRNRRRREEHRGDTWDVQAGRQDNTSKDDPKRQARNTTNKHCHRRPGHETRPGTWTPRATRTSRGFTRKAEGLAAMWTADFLSCLLRWSASYCESWCSTIPHHIKTRLAANHLSTVKGGGQLGTVRVGG